jgi:hypothetical protein
LDTDLQAGGFGYALVGGFAVTLRAEPRTTRDLDVVLVVSGDREAERAALVLRMRGYTDHPKGAAIERLGIRDLSGAGTGCGLSSSL